MAGVRGPIRKAGRQQRLLLHGRGYRSRRVVSVLLEGAIEAARRAGAPAIEAYPVDMDAPRHTNNDYSGRLSTFSTAGFRVVARPRWDRPVVRLDLTR